MSLKHINRTKWFQVIMVEVPLEKRMMTLDGINGVRKDVPAIHEVWKQTREWFPYLPPPSQQELMLTGTLYLPPPFSTGTYADRYCTLPLLLNRNLCWQVLYPPPPSLQELMLTGTLPSHSFSTGTYADRYFTLPLLLYRNLCWQVLYLLPPS